MDPLFPFRRDFPGGRFAYIVPLTYGRGRVVLGDPVAPTLSILDGW